MFILSGFQSARDSDTSHEVKTMRAAFVIYALL